MTTSHPAVLNSFPPETLEALSAMNMAFADVVIENHRLGLPVLQWRDGAVARVPAEELLPLALRFMETNGEPTPEQIGAAAQS
jgi:hypothetical protein